MQVRGCVISVVLYCFYVTGFSAASTAKIFIGEVLRNLGFQAPETRTYASLPQLYMILQSRAAHEECYDFLTNENIEVSANAKRFLFQKFDELFSPGVTIQKLAIMYGVAGALATLFFKRGFAADAFAWIPNWVDQYLTCYMKPVLLVKNRWSVYEKCLNVA